jgi:gliding motility associated protien GldN
MKRVLFILFAAVLTQAVVAQPQQRRNQQAQQRQQQAQKSNANTMTTRAQISFPTQATMSEDVVWRRDIYRELDLTQDANAGLYYPVEPMGSQMNLFTYMFKLMMRGAKNGGIAAYKYNLDGNEVFNDSSRVKPLEFLDNYGIYYERNQRGIRLEDADIPSREVRGYYLKESAYYDQATSTFHTKVLALCPIMYREDEFYSDAAGDGELATKYPLFWVKYDDLAPFLAKQTIMTSDKNNAATMSVDDYFTLNMYRGKIYKTTNMLGRTLAQICGNDTAKMSAAQKRIEAELEEFEKHVWGDQQLKDSLDSVANAQKELKPKKQKASRSARSSGSSVKQKRSKESSTRPSSSAARVSVRRERH